MNAIILAAGHGSRMITSKQFIHKPLLPIQGMPNIERTILMLNDFGIEEIFIIAGTYADQYMYLQKKYNCIIIADIHCSISTLYGMYYVKDKINDTFIIEGDVVLAENVFRYETYSYYYVMKYKNPEKDSWKPIIDTSGKIISFDIGYFKSPCIFGISFWSKHDAKQIQNYLNQICTLKNLNDSSKFWDDYLIDYLNLLSIYTYEISPDSAIEMNDIHEYVSAEELCQNYYLHPDRYFLNINDNKNHFSFSIDEKLAIEYTQKLLEDYNIKHPDDIQQTNIPLKFANNEFSYIVGYEKNIIGFFDLVFEEKYLLLRRIYIDKKYRNCSFGSNLLKKSIVFSKLIDKELRVNVYDECAARFYKRLGFKLNFINYAFRGE